tara:strand:- start:7262 stop:8254 length:993 start_codon:yes stop_codon:yes gene_type:complete
VTSISYQAFALCSSLVSVTIGDSVTSIGVGAFYQCSKLQSVKIPDLVTSIGTAAFADCVDLSSVTFGVSCEVISGQAFNNCTSLTKLIVSRKLNNIGEKAFMNCNKLGTILVPDLSNITQGIDNFKSISSNPSIYIYKPKLKLLALHGGGQDGDSFKSQKGVQDLINSLVDYDIDFPSAPSSNRVWIEDPPGGKGTSTTSTAWANQSLEFLDNYIEKNGPYDAILGYSQGVPMVLLYLASRNYPVNRVSLYNGYLPTTHQGLMETINNLVYSNYSPLIFLGEQDTNFYSLGLKIKTQFTNYLEVIDSATGHDLPNDSAPTYQNTIDYYTI